jgi:DNA-directed RNA polymerase specialized sigma24 family protein
MYRFARRLTGGDSDRAEDIVQEALPRAWRPAPRPECGKPVNRTRRQALKGDRVVQ